MQLSQANAKLSSEGASARARLVEMEDAAEKAGHDFEVERYSGVARPRPLLHVYKVTRNDDADRPPLPSTAIPRIQ